MILLRDIIKMNKRQLIEAIDAPPVSAQSHIQHVEKPAAPNNVVNVDPQKVYNYWIVLATIIEEIGGEGRNTSELKTSSQAVMNVIMNRANGDFDKAARVVLSKMQFSGWNSIGRTDDKIKQHAIEVINKYRSHKDRFDIINGIVEDAKNGKLKDITNKSTHYLNPDSVKKIPSWTKVLTPTYRIGHHNFYKLPDKNEKQIAKLEEVIVDDDIVDSLIRNVDTIQERILKSKYAFIKYSYAPQSKIFYIDSIQTPNINDQGKGYISTLLDKFFIIIKTVPGARLDVGAYTAAGDVKLKGGIDRRAKENGIKFIKGKDLGFNNGDEYD